MYKIIISIFVFSMLLGFTSLVKTQTRIIEKNIKKIEVEISLLEKDLHETELDFAYLSSPGKLTRKIREFSSIDYIPMDYSKIYLNLKEFINSKNKITTLNTINGQKTKKK